MTTPLKQLDKALGALRDLGLIKSQPEEAPVVALIDRIAHLDPDKTVAIARTLSQASLFNEVVREHISAMSIGERYRGITEAFNTIRDDAKAMVAQVEDGEHDRIRFFENLEAELFADVAGACVGSGRRVVEILKLFQFFKNGFAGGKDRFVAFDGFGRIHADQRDFRQFVGQHPNEFQRFLAGADAGAKFQIEVCLISQFRPELFFKQFGERSQGIQKIDEGDGSVFHVKAQGLFQTFKTGLGNSKSSTSMGMS